MSLKGPPFEFFDILQQKAPFSKCSRFFQKSVLRFLGLRYSADFRRSRLVFNLSKRASSSFYILQQKGRSKNPKGSPFYIFWHYATYRRLQKKFERKFSKFSIIFFSFFRHSATSFRQKNFRKGSAFIFSGVLRQNGS